MIPPPALSNNIIKDEYYVNNEKLKKRSQHRMFPYVVENHRSTRNISEMFSRTRRCLRTFQETTILS